MHPAAEAYGEKRGEGLPGERQDPFGYLEKLSNVSFPVSLASAVSLSVTRSGL